MKLFASLPGIACAILLSGNALATDRSVSLAAPTPLGTPLPDAEPDLRYGEPNRADRSFIRTAKEIGIATVSLSDIVAKSAEHEEVRAFAQDISRRHQQMNTQLDAFAQQLGIHTAESATSRMRERRRNVENASGTYLRRLYLDTQVQNLQKLVSIFQGEATGGDNPPLQHFARNQLPELHTELERARRLAAEAAADAS